MRLSEAKKSTKFHLLQTGMPASGKTIRACSAIRFGKVLVVDADNKFGGMVDRVKKLFGAEEAEAKIQFIPITNGAEWAAFMKDIKKLTEGYSTLVIDTYNRAYEHVIEDLMKKVKDGRQAYLAGLPMFKEHLNIMMGLPLNLILNNHVANAEQPDGSLKLVATTAGKLGNLLPGYFNEVHYCYLDTLSKRKVRGEPANGVDARTVQPAEMLDAMGIFKVGDLSVFDNSAYRAGSL